MRYRWGTGAGHRSPCAKLSACASGWWGGRGPRARGSRPGLADAGHDVVLGSRDEARAAAVVAELQGHWGDRLRTLVPGTNAAAAAEPVVFIATVWDAAVATAGELADQLDGAVVVSMANGLEKHRPPVPAGAAPRRIRRRRGRRRRARARRSWPPSSTCPPPRSATSTASSSSDVLVVGDDDDARATVIGLVDEIPGLHGLDAGNLVNAVGIEAFAAAAAHGQPPSQGRGDAAARGRRRPPPPEDRHTSRRRAAVTIRLHDTAQRAVVPFEVGPTVTMYVCGITPYDSTHLGHAATFLTYDVLIRRLEELGHEVRMVRNVTDVDDSILPKARELGVPFLELAESELARFRSDMDALEMRPPVAEPRATESIDGMIDMVRHAARPGARVRGPRHRLLRRVDVPALRRAVALPA